MRRAVFLDRDGTLIENQHYQFRPDRMRLLGGVVNGLRALQHAGFGLVVVTNQSGVARGIFDESNVREMHAHLANVLADRGVTIDAFYYCPHHREGCVPAYSLDCQCRKPKPGMIKAAARDLGLSLAQSWLIGDINDDVEAGFRAGCRTVLLDPNGTELKKSNGFLPTYSVGGFLQAATIIVAHTVHRVAAAPESRLGQGQHSPQVHPHTPLSQSLGTAPVNHFTESSRGHEAHG